MKTLARWFDEAFDELGRPDPFCRRMFEVVLPAGILAISVAALAATPFIQAWGFFHHG